MVCSTVDRAFKSNYRLTCSTLMSDNASRRIWVSAEASTQILIQQICACPAYVRAKELSTLPFKWLCLLVFTEQKRVDITCCIYIYIYAPFVFSSWLLLLLLLLLPRPLQMHVHENLQSKYSGTDDEANSSFRCCVICEFREIILFIYSYSDLLDVVSE